MNAPTVGIVCGSGGYKGAAHIGWLKALLPILIQKKLPIIYLGGVSVGALNVSKLAEAQNQEELLDRLVELENTWIFIEKMGSDYIFPTPPFTGLRKQSLLDGRTLWKLIQDKTPLNAKAITQSPFQCDIFVYDEQERRQKIFSNRDTAIQKNPYILHSAVVASASLAPFFPPVSINGVPYSDGLHISLTRAIEAGCSMIFVLLPYRKDGQEDKPPNILTWLYPSLQRVFDSKSSLVHELDSMEIARALEINKNVSSLETLATKIKSLFRLPSRKKTADSILQNNSFTFTGKQRVEIIPIYIEQELHTLSMYTFSSWLHDISRLIQSSEASMQNLLSTLQL